MRNCTVEIPIDGTLTQFGADKEVSFLDSYPSIVGRGKRIRYMPITETLFTGLDITKYWRIKYKDVNDTVTNRTVYDVQVIEVKEPDGLKMLKVPYLKALCLLRNGETRYFRIDRIMRLQILDVDIASPVKTKKRKIVDKKKSTRD